MGDLISDFLVAPSADTYLAVRSRIVNDESYEPYSMDFALAVQCLEEGNDEGAYEILTSAMPNFMLSPRVHMVLAAIQEREGNTENAEFERYFASACCQGILDTGDGTEESPYVVMRTSDEHDVIGYLEKTFESQALIEVGDRNYDLITCGDGTEYWFDVTDLLNRQSAQSEE